MQSLRELYRIGMGPSSSHTMGPRRAAEVFRQKHPDAARVRVTLHGSLAATGKGHLTDQAILQGLAPLQAEILWDPKPLAFHPNGMTFEALSEQGTPTATWTVFSIGGGEIREPSGQVEPAPSIYPLRHMATILAWAQDRCGATGACVPVVAANGPAVALYEGLGFRTEAFRYHYRRRPGAGEI